MRRAVLSQQVDQVYKRLGVWGKWQIGQVALLVAMQIPAAFQLFSIVFIGYQPDFTCLQPNASIQNNEAEDTYGKKCYSNTTEVSSCPGDVEYRKPPGLTTIVTEWDLVCSESYTVQLTQTILIAGQAVGATLFTNLADRYGRKRVCMICQLLLLLVGVGTAFSPNILVFTLLRFPMGALQQSLVMTFTVLPMEIIPMDQRIVVHAVFGSLWAVSQSLLVVVGYAFHNESWRYLQLALCSSSLFVLVLQFVFLDESLRWLLVNDKVEEVKAIVRQASRLNNIPLQEKDLDDAVSVAGSEMTTVSLSSLPSLSTVGGKSSSTTQIQVKAEKYTVLDLLRLKTLRCTTLVLFFAWIVNALVYFALNLTSAKLAGNRFLNFFLLVVVEFPAALVTYFVMKGPGRRVTCIVFHAIAGVVLIISGAIYSAQDESLLIYVTVLSLVGKFAISSSWACLFNYTTELYPTNARSIGLGLASSASRIGGMLAPFTNLVIEIDAISWLPGVVFGVSSLVVAGLMVLVPETCDKPLPQTIEDIESWDHKVGCCYQKSDRYANTASTC